MIDTRETRHYHGNTWHDHIGGDRPHTHEVSKGNGTLIFSAVSLLCGLMMILVYGHNYGACQNLAVAALNQAACSDADNMHTWGILMLALAAILLVVGLVRRFS